MQISKDAIIPESKLTHYLLVFKAENDKSKFLAQAGFVRANVGALQSAIRELVDTNEAIEDGINEYGTFYRVAGSLTAIRRKSLSVVTIWLQRKADSQFWFVTLKPYREIR
ncbi:MAG: DUF6883 domain-containing protein [Phormidesmis sp.]